MYEYRTLDIGNKEDLANKLVVFQVMYRKHGSVLCTLGVWAPTVKGARVIAGEYRDKHYKGCPVPWRETFTGEVLAQMRAPGGSDTT